jgi:hypothetical protein
VRQDLRQRLALTPRKAAYVYIHGYNTLLSGETDCAYAAKSMS